MNDAKFEKVVRNWFERPDYSIYACPGSHTLAAIWNALLPKLMSGEVQVQYDKRATV